MESSNKLKSIYLWLHSLCSQSANAFERFGVMGYKQMHTTLQMLEDVIWKGAKEFPSQIIQKILSETVSQSFWMSTLSFSSQTMRHPCKPLMSLPCSVVTGDKNSPIRSLDSDQPWWQDWWLNKIHKWPETFGLSSTLDPQTAIHAHT